MKDIDNLPISQGVKYLGKGYIDYSEAVITERAISNVYDGLKPVNRRILHTVRTQFKKNQFEKSAKMVGNTMGSYHPHGDTAIYKASVPMSDKNGGYAFPVLEGAGNWGDVSTGARAAAYRYTEVRLHENAKEFFGEMNGIDMIPNFDASLTEPKVLPVSFPNILINASEGIAVGFSSKIPSFNFNDVIDLCIEYIKDGECHTVIAPDFVTGGYYIKNNKELKKLMVGGKASLKLRGRVTVDGKYISVIEVPYGKPVQYLKDQIDAKDIDGVRNCGNISDRNNNDLRIECRSKNSVNSVLYSLYKDTDLQSNYNANMVVVQDGAPKLMGVWEIIAVWTEWRKKVLTRHLLDEESALKAEIRESKAFSDLIAMTDIKNEFATRIARDGRKSAVEWLKEQDGVMDVIPEDLFQFVSTRNINNYHTGGSIVEKYNKIVDELYSVQHKLQNIDEELLHQYERLKQQYGNYMPRKTEVTNVDYEFASREEEEILDTSPCYYAVSKNFIKKLRYEDTSNEYEYQFSGTASDTLIAIDSAGQVLRIYGSEIPYNAPSDLGVYIPRYLGIDVDDDVYRVLWVNPLDGGEKTLIYKDGTVGFLNTSEWVGLTRQAHVIKNGVSPYAYEIGAVLDELPEVLMAVDSEGRLGYTLTKNIKHKNRTARTRVFKLKKDVKLVSFCPCSFIEFSLAVQNAENYEAPRMSHLLGENDFDDTAVEFIGMM